jgi:beta-galactosidase/beta-glucuronidase
LLASRGGTAAAAVQTMSLDGADWLLELNPADPAVLRMKAAGNKTKGPISVPGAWQAQGFGEETVALKNQYIGAATYSKTVAVPAPMVAKGRSLWVVAERIERSAKLVVGKKLVAEHTGYLSRLEGDVSGLVGAGGSLQLELIVNATRDAGYDGLVGCNDLVMDGSIVGGWVSH